MLKVRLPIFNKTNPFSLIFILMILLLISPFPTLGSEPIILDDTLSKKQIGRYVEYIEDKEHRLTIDDLANRPVKWEESNGETLNFGLTKSVYWFRFTINNKLDKEIIWYFEIKHPFIDYIDLYIPENSGQFKIKKAGDQFPFYTREINDRNFVFPIKIKPGQYTYYIRIKSEDSMTLPFIIWSLKAYMDNLFVELPILWIYYGMMILMIFYNLFIFFSVRERSYIYFVIFIISYILTQLTINGFAFQYLWPNSIWWANNCASFFICFAGFWLCLFSRSYLQTKKNSISIDKIIIINLIAIILWSALCLVSNLSRMYKVYGAAFFTTFEPTLLLIASIIILIKKKFRPAIFYVISFSIFLFGITLFGLRAIGVFPSNFLTQWSIQIGSATMVVLLSLGLADKLNIFREEKEQAQALALENLHKADKLKDEFLANTSHELRTPLNGIIGLAEAVRDRIVNIAPDQVTNLSLLVSSGRRLLGLVNDILDYSRLKNRDIDLQLKPIDLKSLTDVVLGLCKPLISKKDLVLKNLIHDTIPLAYADENRVQQILYNLIGNAIKFTKSGSIEVSAQTVKKDESDSFLEISISDTGIGIPEDKQEKIFESFEQADGSISREYGGTGIGLSIVRQLVELHGGKIWVESKVNEGSKFIFTLPSSKEQEIDKGKDRPSPVISKIQDINYEEVPVTDESMKNMIGEKGNLLIVDDDPVNLHVVKNYLINEDYSITLATSGQEALDMIKNIEYDCMLLDIMMPRISGYEVCHILRDQYSLYELPIIFLTAKNRVSDLVAGFAVGANDYLTKPINKEELLARVNTLIALKRAVKEHKEAKFKLLQERMSPHFLFNALNSIHALLYIDIKTADKAIFMLSDNYRFIMEHTSKALVPFDKEWEFVKNYLELEELRFSDTLSIEIDKKGDFEKVLIPPLTLQPLVENCFKHGELYKKEKGYIGIFAKIIENRVTVEVLDNGKGIKGEDIYSRSLGNISKRLNYYYKGSELTAHNRDEGGVSVVISFQVEGNG